jgi:TetR/AcrR family transcriptional regulator
MRDDTTHDRILQVAAENFYRKGLAGARMQEIGDAAGVNKAMLHYYFKTKAQLFETVFQRALGLFLGGLAHVFASPLPLRQKIARYVDYCVDELQANPSVAVFIIHELHQRPERLTEQMALPLAAHMTSFRTQWQAESKHPDPSAIAADRLFTDMVSLCVYPFLAKPLLQRVLEKGDSAYAEFLQDRKDSIKKHLLAQV